MPTARPRRRTCAARGIVASPVTTFSPPSTICAASAATLQRARRRTRAPAPGVVRTRTATQTISAPATSVSAAVQEHREGAVGRQARDQPPAHQRPVAEGEAGTLGPHVGPDQQQEVREGGRDRARVAAGPATAGSAVGDVAGALAPTAIATTRPSTRNAIAKWIVTTAGSSPLSTTHPPSAPWATKSGASTTDPHAGQAGAPIRCRASATIATTAIARASEPGHDREEPVDVLDDRVELPRRNPRTEAGRPVGARVARARGAHQTAPADEDEGARRGQGREGPDGSHRGRRLEPADR